MEGLDKPAGWEICYAEDHLLVKVVEIPSLRSLELDWKRLEDAVMAFLGLVPSEKTHGAISACLLAVRITDGIKSRRNLWIRWRGITADSLPAAKLHLTVVIMHVNEAGRRVPSCQVGSQQTCPEQGWAHGIV